MSNHVNITGAIAILFNMHIQMHAMFFAEHDACRQSHSKQTIMGQNTIKLT